MRRQLILPLVLALSALLAGVAVASQRASESRGRTAATSKQQADLQRTRDEFQTKKKKTGDDILVIGVWRNCKFHVLKLPAERYTAVLPDGQVQESVEVAHGATAADAAEKLLPARDPACDNVEPSREQIDANRAALEEEEARLHPGTPTRPGG